MTYRLPPLNALRAFEAAARHLSFKRAATELHVTAGAVSQHVRGLEDILGVALFERIHNGLILTEAGQRYLAPLRSAFTTISIATESVNPRSDDAELVIGTDPDFAIQWLVPRLQGLTPKHGTVRFKIAEARDPEPVLTGRAQIALLPDVATHPELTVRAFLQEKLFPAGAPGHPSGERLDGPMLVADDADRWRRWLTASGRPALDRHKRIDFAERDLAVRAAELGRGLVLASNVADHSSLEDGRLRPVVGGPWIDGRRWYLLCPPGRIDCSEEAGLLSWLTAEGARPPGGSSPVRRVS